MYKINEKNRVFWNENLFSIAQNFFLDNEVVWSGDCLTKWHSYYVNIICWLVNVDVSYTLPNRAIEILLFLSNKTVQSDYNSIFNMAEHEVTLLKNMFIWVAIMLNRCETISFNVIGNNIDILFLITLRQL